MSRELPILLNTEMVRAILDGRKTITRTPIKEHPNFVQWNPIILNGYGGWCDEHGRPLKAPSEVGDLLYVRETHFKNGEEWIYLADGSCCEQFEQCECEEIGKPKWRPNIHMLKEAARIWLKVTDVRVERVQYINTESIRKEGLLQFTKDGNIFKWGLPSWHWQDMPTSAKAAFCKLWESIYGETWQRNDWVWVREFERIEK